VLIRGGTVIDPSQGLQVRHPDHVAALRTIEAHRDLIRGIKIRMSRNLVGANSRIALTTAPSGVGGGGPPDHRPHRRDPDAALRAPRRARAGDVMTHCYHGREGRILDERGAVIPAARRAAGPGVLFDVGHGRGSFACSVAGQALGFGVLTLIGESSQWS